MVLRFLMVTVRRASSLGRGKLERDWGMAFYCKREGREDGAFFFKSMFTC